MYFLIDNKKKIIFGWSAKCGCSHIKHLFNFLVNIDIQIPKLHDYTYNYLPTNFNEFMIIIFIRNPYERIISGFIDKYKVTGSCNKKWNKKIPLTFRNFTLAVSRNNRQMIDKHHFAPQLTEAWDEKLKAHQDLKVYDISNIDYAFLECLYSKKIPPSVVKFRGGHEVKSSAREMNHSCYDDTIDTLTDMKPRSKFFYCEEIFNRVTDYYKRDIDYFRSLGFDYKIDIL
jgi:hypothetical protein